MSEIDTPSVGRRAPSIGRVQLLFDGDWSHAGTGFVVAPRYALTAMHVVANLEDGAKRSDKIQLMLGSTAFAATVVKSDAAGDWALLELDRDAGVPAIPTGPLRDASTTFSTWGFPTFNENGSTFFGRIVNRGYRIGESAAFELKAETANNVPMKGLSGAPCVVNGIAIGVMRAAHMKGTHAAPTVIGGALFATPIDTIRATCGALIPEVPEFPDLPPLPERTLPDEPFVYLNAYGADHAELYFGRTAKIYELYRAISSTDHALILLVGASGVGKSSMLAAGLAPRLTSTWDVKIVRPDANPLATTVGAFEDGERPLLVILDQLEERFAAIGEAKAGEELAEVIAALGKAKRRCKLLLGFREESLAPITRVLERVGPLPMRIDLQRMDKDDVVEALTGITRTPRLHAKYGFTLDDKLADTIAVDLVEDPSTPVAPSLQVLLTKLYRAAKATNNGVVTPALYSTESRAKYLDAFLAERLETAKQKFPGPSASGLVHDILDFHIERPSRALIRTPSDRSLAYGDRTGIVDPIIDWMTRDGRMLITIDGTATRLVHDTLVPLVRDACLSSQRVGQRARRLVDLHVQQGQPARADDWKTLRAGLASTRVMRGPEAAYVDECKAASSSQRRIRSGLSIAGVAFLVVLGIVLVIAVRARKVSNENTRKEQLARAEELFATSHRYVERGDLANAARTAGKALELADKDPRATTYRDWILSLARLIPEKALRFSGEDAFATPDGFVVVRRGGKSQLWDLDRERMLWEGEGSLVKPFSTSMKPRTFHGVVDYGQHGPSALLVANETSGEVIAPELESDEDYVGVVSGSIVIRKPEDSGETLKWMTYDKTTDQRVLVGRGRTGSLTESALFTAGRNQVCRDTVPPTTPICSDRFEHGEDIVAILPSRDGAAVAILANEGAKPHLGLWFVDKKIVEWRRISTDNVQLLDVSTMHGGLVLYNLRRDNDDRNARVRLSLANNNDVELTSGGAPQGSIAPNHVAVLVDREEGQQLETWSLPDRDRLRSIALDTRNVVLSHDGNSMTEVRGGIAARFSLAPPEHPTLPEIVKPSKPMVWRDDCSKVMWLPRESEMYGAPLDFNIAVADTRKETPGAELTPLGPRLAYPKSLFVGADGVAGVLTRDSLVIVRGGVPSIYSLGVDYAWHTAAFTSNSHVVVFGRGTDEWAVIDFDLASKKPAHDVCKHSDELRPLGLSRNGAFYMLERLDKNDELYHDVFSTSCKRQDSRLADTQFAIHTESLLRQSDAWPNATLAEPVHASDDTIVEVAGRDRWLSGNALHDTKTGELVSWNVFPDSIAAPLSACIARSGEILMVGGGGEVHHMAFPAAPAYVEQIVIVLSAAMRGNKGQSIEWFNAQRKLREMLEQAKATDPYARSLLRHWGSLPRPPEIERVAPPSGARSSNFD